MIINYVLMDYENIQPKELSALDAEHFRIMVFIGASQKNIPVELGATLQPMGTRAEYLRITGNGKNALDFHIAFYIGRIATQNPTAKFYIISIDNGYDPLIEHLKVKGICVTRLCEISKIPLGKTTNIKIPQTKLCNVSSHLQIRPTNKKSSAEKIKIIIDNLLSLGASKPKTFKKLSSTINSFFSTNLSDKELTTLINAIKNKNFLTVSDTGTVSYPTDK